MRRAPRSRIVDDPWAPAGLDDNVTADRVNEPMAPIGPPPLRALALLTCCSGALLLGGCQPKASVESQRLDQLELKIQQLEERLNQAGSRPADGADRAGKPPAGVIKSLTLRSGSEDDRLRIYWADGSTTDLPCTKEQTTLACG